MVQHSSIETSTFTLDLIIRLFVKCAGQPLPETSKGVKEDIVLPSREYKSSNGQGEAAEIHC